MKINMHTTLLPSTLGLSMKYILKRLFIHYSLGILYILKLLKLSRTLSKWCVWDSVKVHFPAGIFDADKGLEYGLSVPNFEYFLSRSSLVCHYCSVIHLRHFLVLVVPNQSHFGMNWDWFGTTRTKK